MKRSVVIPVTIICIALVGYAGWKWFSPQISSTLTTAKSADSRGGNQRGAGAVPVTIAVAQTGSMPIIRQTIGTIIPFASTAVSSPAPGIVATVAIKDGAEVKASDLIVQLDDRAIQAAIGKDNAAIAKDQATLDDANISLNRIRNLVRSGVDTSQAGDDAVAAVKVAQAQIGVDQAQLAADNVALTNTRITAPFDGQLGVVLVSQGAFVSARVTCCSASAAPSHCTAPIWLPSIGVCTGCLPCWYSAGFTPRRSSNAATMGHSFNLKMVFRPLVVAGSPGGNKRPLSEISFRKFMLRA